MAALLIKAEVGSSSLSFYSCILPNNNPIFYKAIQIGKKNPVRNVWRSALLPKKAKGQPTTKIKHLALASSCILIRARIPPQQLWPMTKMFSTCNENNSLSSKSGALFHQFSDHLLRNLIESYTLKYSTTISCKVYFT